MSLMVRPVPRSHVLLILYDGILLWAVLLAGWNVTHLMTFFVVETLVMAVIAIPRIVLAQRVDLDPFYEGSSSNADLKGAKLFFLFVFVASFNLFTCLCIATLSGEISGPGIRVQNGFSPWTLWQELFFGKILLTSVLYWSLVLLIIAAHTVIFQQEFLKESKYRSAIPHNELPGPILRSACGTICALVGFSIMVAARIQWPAIIVFLLGKYMVDAIELQDSRDEATETAPGTPAKTRKERIPPH